MDIQHRFAVPITQPRMHFFTKDGKPLVGGRVYSFKVGTDEFKPTYRNSEQTSLNQNPIVLDNSGGALIYLKGSHLLRVYDKNNVLIQEVILPLQKMRSQFFDDIGRPLSYGKVYTFDYESTLRKKSYANADEAQLNPNPVILDELGWASISIVGAYRLRSHDKNGVFIRDQDFKGLPVKALTSWVYPLYFEENLTAETFIVKNSVRIGVGYVDDNLSASTSILSATLYTITNQSISINESISTEFSINNATIRSNLTSLDMGNEKLSALLALTQSTQKTVLITTQSEAEKISTNIAISSAQITN